MNNKTIWIVGLVVVVAIAGFLLMSNKKAGYETNSNPQTEVKDSSNTVNPVKNASLKELIGMGSTQKCSFKTNEAEGTFYVSDGKARGDFSSTVDKVTTSGHMITDSKTSYVWMDGQPKGFSMSLEAMEKAQSSSTSPATQAPQAVDYNEKVDYKCEKWTPDSSMFTVPSNVEFMDMSAMVESSAKMMQDAQNMDKNKLMEDAMKQMQDKMGQ